MNDINIQVGDRTIEDMLILKNIDLGVYDFIQYKYNKVEKTLGICPRCKNGMMDPLNIVIGKKTRHNEVESARFMSLIGGNQFALYIKESIHEIFIMYFCYNCKLYIPHQGWDKFENEVQKSIWR